MKTTRKYIIALAVLTAGSVFYGSNPASSEDIELNKVEAAVEPVHRMHGRFDPTIPPPPPPHHRPPEFRQGPHVHHHHHGPGHVPPQPPEFRHHRGPGDFPPPPPGHRPHRPHRPPHRW